MGTAIDLSGQVAFVTGAASGIGRATALALARSGASVAVADINREGAAETVAQAEAAGGKAHAIHISLAHPDSVSAAFTACDATLGAPQILVNCAGGNAGGGGLLTELDLDGWDRTFALNVKGTLLCCRAALPAMIARRQGAIVNVASSSGFRLQAGGGAYAVAKAAVPALTKVLANEVGPHGITVNCIVPSLTDTPFTRRVFGGDEGLAAQVQPGAMLANPLGVVLSAEDQAWAILVLCAPSSRHITGQAIHVNGGHYMP